MRSAGTQHGSNRKDQQGNRLFQQIFGDVSEIVDDHFDRLKQKMDNHYQMDMFIMLQNSNPRCKLEHITRSKLLCITIIFVVLMLFSVGTSIIYASLSKYAFERTKVPELAQVIVMLQFILHVLAAAIGLFLLISFPQRILVRLLRDEIKPLPEQIVLIFIIIIINLTPQFSTVASICMGKAVLRTFAFDEEDDSQGERFLEYFGGRCELVTDHPFNRSMTIIFLCTVFLSWGMLVKLQAIPHEVDTIDTRRDQHKSKPNIITRSEYGSSVVEEVGGVLNSQEDIKREANKNKLIRTFDSIKKPSLTCCHYICYPFKSLISCCSEKRYNLLKETIMLLHPGVDGILLFLVLIYFVFVMTGTFVLNYVESFVPVVSLVTVLRVCIDSRDDVPYDSLNISLTKNCEYTEPGFPRSIIISIALILQLVIIWQVFRIKHDTKRTIKSLPYAQHRSTHLLSNFFNVFNGIAVFFGLVVSLIIVTTTPIEVWIFEVDASPSGTLQVRYDPLHNVGITGVFQVPNVFLIVVVWCFTLCYAYLPPDSYGFKGWFVGCDNLEGKEAEHKRVEDLEHPIYLARESDFSIIGELRQNLSKTLCSEMCEPATNHEDVDVPTDVEILPEFRSVRHSARKAVFERIQSTVIKTAHNLDDELQNEDENGIILQLKSNVFVMETEILLFNFSCITYWTKKNKSFEENAALIGDKNFTLVELIHNEKTDTHCIVAVSDDRIVLAFRGTVSGLNVRTDLDYALVQLPWIGDFEANPSMTSSTISVHNGFLRAFTSIEDQLCSLVKSLLSERPHRVILCTGHSLGGGLAVLAAFYSSLKFNPKGVACTTFGCPKVGSYSFMTLYNQRVPTTRRFVNVRDLVPRLPPSSFLADITKKGYFHVGIQVDINLDGNMIIGPNRLEKQLLAGFRRYSKSYHFNSRYTLGLVTWCVKTHYGEWQPNWWVNVVQNLVRYCNHIIAKKDKEMTRKLKYVLHREGVEYTGNRGKLLRNMGVQTTPDHENSVLLNSPSGESRCETSSTISSGDVVSANAVHIGSEKTTRVEDLELALNSLVKTFETDASEDLKPLLVKLNEVSQQAKRLSALQSD